MVLRYGTAGDDRLIGTPAADRIYGRNGDDIIWGQSGNDLLDGGRGRDKIDGGNGNDRMLGGADLDLMRGHNGDDTMLGGGGEDRLFGGNGRDRIWGGSGDDELSSGDDNARDLLFGDAGSDRIDLGRGDKGWGGVDNDAINAVHGDATALGEDGDDQIHANGAAVVWTGGAGADRATALGLDNEVVGLTITDYVSGEDRLSISVDGMVERVGDTFDFDSLFDLNSDGRITPEGDGLHMVVDGEPDWTAEFRQDESSNVTGLEFHLDNTTVWLPGVDAFF